MDIININAYKLYCNLQVNYGTEPVSYKVLKNCHLATMLANGTPYGLIKDAVIVLKNDRIIWSGQATDAPQKYQDAEHIDVEGRLVTPALIDCHTHVVFAGNRAREFEMRLNGASYEQVARAGGGIVSTVEATRAATQEALVSAALPRVDALIAEGVSTIEIKSGYGLNQEDELKMLRAARQIAKLRGIHVTTTYLGAHAVPPEYTGREDTYIDTVCIPTLHLAHTQGLVDAVDAFCEGIAFQPAQVARVFDAARALGLPVKIHAEQLSNLGGAKMAAQYGALSADHIEYLDVEGVAAMARAGTVAVILPGAFYTLRETQAPPHIHSARLRCADRTGQRLQSRVIAHDIAFAYNEHGLHVISHDPRRGPLRRDTQCCKGAWSERLWSDRGRCPRRSGGLECTAPCRVVLSDWL